MSIRIGDVPGVPLGYDLTGKVIMIHDTLAPLDSSTNTIPIQSLITFAGLPDQLGNNGKVLTTDGVSTYWQLVSLPTSTDLLPIQTGNSGKYLTTDGVLASWVSMTYPLQNINLLLPSQTGNNGKYLITDGTISSWSIIPGLSDGSKTDIIVSGSGATWTIAANAVTYSKIQLIPANRILGNATGASASMSEISLGQGLAFQSSNQLYIPDNTTTQKIKFLVNNTLISTRQAINFSFSGITPTFSDDISNDVFNLNLVSTGGGTLSILKNGVAVASSANLNFIQGTNTTLNAVNNIGLGRIDLTINSTSSIYSNSTPITSTLGGITTGLTFSNKTLQEMFDSLLYPYQSPSFLSLSLAQTLFREIGNSFATGQTFTWSTANNPNIAPNSLILSGYNLTTLNSLTNDGTETVTFTSIVNRTSADGPGVRAWFIQGLDTNSVIFNSSLTINWDWKLYVGTSTNSVLTETNIKALTIFNSIKNGFVGIYSFPSGGYKYFCFAIAYGTPNSFIDTSNNLNVSMYSGYSNIDSNGNSYDLVSVTNTLSQITNYKVYRTTNQLGGAINISVN